MEQRIVGREGSRNFLDSMDEHIKKRGYELAANFFALWKSLKMYGEENDAVRKAVEKNMDTFRYFFQTMPTVSIGYNGTDIIINDQRLKGKRGGEDYLEMLSQIFLTLYIGELSFSSDITAADLIMLCLVTKNITPGTPGNEEMFKNINTALTAKTSKITATMFNPVDDELPPIIDKPQMARQVYRSLVLDFPGFQKKVFQKQPLQLKKAVRNIQNLIDLLQDESDDRQWSHLLTLASLDSYHKMYIPTHAANTTILAIACAITMKAPKKALITTGLAAYFHDIGIPEGETKDEEGMHNERGFEILSRLNSLNFSMMEAAITASSHHDTYDFRGLIKHADNPDIITPIAELVKACDYYDIITRWWPHNPGKPLSRVNAIEWIFEKAKEKVVYAGAVKALFSTLGVYPPGAVLKINGKPLYAFSIGGYMHNYDQAKAMVLDGNMQFVKFETFNAAQLSHLPAEQHYRVPPSTLQIILNGFQVK